MNKKANEHKKQDSLVNTSSLPDVVVKQGALIEILRKPEFKEFLLFVQKMRFARAYDDLINDILCNL